MGRFVYASNRGHDTIATFSVDETTGAANQATDTIVSFRIDQTTGRLSPTGQVTNTGSPST